MLGMLSQQQRANIGGTTSRVEAVGSVFLKIQQKPTSCGQRDGAVVLAENTGLVPSTDIRQLTWLCFLFKGISRPLLALTGTACIFKHIPAGQHSLSWRGMVTTGLLGALNIRSQRL